MCSIPIPQLYRSLHAFVLEALPDRCDTRLTNLLFLMLGLFQARCVQLNHVARKLPVHAKQLSLVKRLTRFLDNPAVLRAWYAPFVRVLLQSAAQGGQVHLIIDATGRRSI